MTEKLPFDDRAHGGRELATQLGVFAGRHDTIVLALPRGGVPVGHEVARALSAPLDVFIVRKLGVPGYPELAMGAIASGGVRVLNDNVVMSMGVEAEDIESVAARESIEIVRREQEYRGTAPPIPLRDRQVILVDDGLATGATMRAAARAVRAMQPSKVVIAVPVAASETCLDLRTEADEVICAATPEPFRAVGLWYSDFSQTTDDEVRALLADSRRTALTQ